MSWENIEKYEIVFVRKEVMNYDENGNESDVTISSKMKFIDGGKIHKIKSKYCDCFLKYENVKINSMKYECSSCNNNYSSKIYE